MINASRTGTPSEDMGIDYRAGAGRGPVIIAGGGPEAIRRAEGTIAAAGLRIAASVPTGEAEQRIDQQVVTGALWLELTRDDGPALDRLLRRVASDTREGRYPAVVSAPKALIDVIFAQLQGTDVEFVVDGTEADRATALALAMSSTRRPGRLSDVASEASAARLRQLSDEVARIAATLSRLSASPHDPAAPPVATASQDPLPEVKIDVVRAVIRARRLRSRYFDEELFADPAWDMLLDLTQAEIAQIRVPVSSLCIAAAVPATTALRWLKTMTDQGLVVRRADPHDGRRVFVEMAQDTRQAMHRYFADVGTTVI